MNNLKSISILISIVLSGTVHADGVVRSPMYEQLVMSKKGELKDRICAGNESRYTHKAVVTFRYPSVAAGTPIDEAAEMKKVRLELVRNGLMLANFSGDFGRFDSRQEKGFRESVVMEHDPIIEALSGSYTFRFPIETLQKVFKLNDPLYYQHRGYDYSTLVWKASKAIRDRDIMWSDYCYRMTTIVETAKSPNEVVFDLGLDLNLFCRAGVAVDDLVTDGGKGANE